MMLAGLRALQQKPIKKEKKVYNYATEKSNPSPRIITRRKELLQYLKRHKKSTLKDLRLFFSVTETTVKKDIAYLKQTHEIIFLQGNSNQTKVIYKKELANAFTENTNTCT